MIKKSVVAVVVSTGIFGTVAHANTLDTDTAVFLADAQEMGTHNSFVVKEWDSLTYFQQQDAISAKPALRTELDSKPKAEPIYTTTGQHTTNERHQQPLVGTTSHLDGTHWTQTPGITKESNPAGNPTGQAVYTPVTQAETDSVNKATTNANQRNGLAVMNQIRTSSQIGALDASRINSHIQEVKNQTGIAKTQVNINRTYQQIAAKEAAESQSRTESNIDRTSSQVGALDASRINAHIQNIKTQNGESKVFDNQLRTASQHVTPEYYGATVRPNTGASQTMATGTKVSPEGQPVDYRAQAQAKLTADKYAAANAPHDGVNGKDGITTVISKTDTATQDAVKGLQLTQANQLRTSSQHATEQPRNGKDGVTTVITKTDTKTQQQVSRNSDNIQLMQGEVISESHARYNGDIASVKSANNYTDQRIKSVEDQQSNDRKEYRAGIAGAVAISGLHYVDTDNSVAIGAGSFKDAQGYSMGYRHKFAENVAATVAASETSNGDAVFSASAAVGW